MWNWYSLHFLLGNSDIFHSLESNYNLMHIAASYASYKKMLLRVTLKRYQEWKNSPKIPHNRK